MNPDNLNINFIPSKNDDEAGWKRLKEFTSNNITVHFNGIEESLVKYISKAQTCLGCIAWLTNEKLLTALTKCEIVSIIVQKEDFLRPDYSKLISNWQDKQEAWKLKLKMRYDALPRGICQSDFLGFEEEPSFGECFGLEYEADQIFLKMKQQTGISPDGISYAYAWETEAIRCLGEINTLKNPSFPRMHHKFLIFCNNPLEPYAVWTGSFNFSFNATQSLENGLYITDKYIVKAYWYEYIFNFIRSESLDWNAKYQPKLEIGS